MQVNPSALRLWGQFFQREIKNRYLGSLSGLLWVFVHPALLLALYTFLIAGVLKARIPELTDAQWLPYVALGLWPWMCFSEGLQRGSSAVMDYAGLLGKVAMPAEVLVAASVGATFSLHALGLIAVTCVLAACGYGINLTWIGLLLPLLLCLFAFTLGLAWIAAALQVYIRDVAQVLGQFLGFLFFLTPILYTPTMLPEVIRTWLAFNPVSIYCISAREWLMFDRISLDARHAVAVFVALATFGLGLLLFRKLAKHFEDFL
jgi:lipopolysaccharide transport system permease protein